MFITIDNAPSTAVVSKTTNIHEHNAVFPAAAQAMADECALHCYLGVYYNILAYSKQPPWKPPFYCVTRGHVVGVLLRWWVLYLLDGFLYLYLL
jgi:hypothetical protein